MHCGAVYQRHREGRAARLRGSNQRSSFLNSLRERARAVTSFGTGVALLMPAGDAQRRNIQLVEHSMSHQDSKIRAAIAGVLAVGSLAVAGTVLAADDGKEQCAGIVKAGQNDCATSANACHGHATADSMAEAWVYLPKGTCERLTGGRLVNVKVPTPKK